MNIVVCIKFSPDAQDIQAMPDGSISLQRAEWEISGFDLQALEAAVRLVEQHGGTVTAVSMGTPAINQSKLKKDLLSRGANELVLVVDEQFACAGTAMTATVLAAAVRKLPSVDLVLCGEGSADLYYQQVGVQMGERLGWPVFNAVGRLEWVDGKWRVDRHLEDEVEVLEIEPPAVLAVTTDINLTRLPTMKDILSAGKKPVMEWRLSDIGEDELPVSSWVGRDTLPPRRERKKIMIEGSPQDVARSLIEHLKRDGVL